MSSLNRFLATSKKASAAVRSSSSSSPLVTWELVVDKDDTTKKEKTTAIGIITLNSPKTYNALTIEMGDEFRDAIDTIELGLTTLFNVGAIVLRGAGDQAFSAGGDLEWLQSLSKNSPHANVDVMLDFYNSFLCLREKLPIPVVAALQGPAMGAGACLAMACDMRVGASGNVPLLGFPFAKLGIPSGMGAQHLLTNAAKLSSSQVSEILLLGQTLTGEEAHRLGLLNRLVPRDDVQETAKNLALEIARHSHPVAVRAMVRSTRLAIDSGGLKECLYRDAHAQALCYNRADWGEGLSAVMQKRDPDFDGYHSH